MLDEITCLTCFKMFNFNESPILAFNTILAINPFTTSELVHPYNLDEFISSFQEFLMEACILIVLCIFL